MAEYHFLTTWDLEAPLEPVWETINNPLELPVWWKYVDQVALLELNRPDGTGGLYLYRWKTALPYTLAFEMRVTRYDPPHLLEGRVVGELEGVGRWELVKMERYTRVTYDWWVRTKQAWMNLFAPLARPVFSWNHHTVMKEGGQALARHLGVRLLAHKNENLG